MDKAIQNCFDICPSSKCLGTGAVQSRADFNIRTEEVLAEVFVDRQYRFRGNTVEQYWYCWTVSPLAFYYTLVLLQKKWK